MLWKKLCKKNNHFFANYPQKHIFHENLDVFFSKFLDTLARNFFLVDDMLLKSISNDSCSVIFLESFEGSHNDGDYLFSTILPYLVSLHSSRFCVQIYIRHNLFGTIRSINRTDLYYNILFQDYSDNCEPTYCTKENLKNK